mmetsp:Transcript_4875/g.9159  ORF Transcript_4875/g.9159 Transcript_4875/m.9159 type:complete len:249 (-) Transcript_4875:277-1023(-)
MSKKWDVFLLLDGKGLTTSHAKLPLYKVLSGNHFSHWVLDLQASVHLHKEKWRIYGHLFLCIYHKFHGTCADVVYRFGSCYCSISHFLAKLFGHARSRRFFEDLLMTSLHGAVTFVKVYGVSHFVCKYLKFDVARLAQETLDEDSGVAKRRSGLTLACLDVRRQVLFFLHDAHSLSSASHDSLEHDGETNAFCLRSERLDGLVLAVVAGCTGYVGCLHDPLTLRLGSHGHNCILGRADKLNVVGRAHL